MAAQPVLTHLAEQFLPEDAAEGGPVRHVEIAQRRDMPVQFQRGPATAEQALFDTANVIGDAIGQVAKL